MPTVNYDSARPIVDRIQRQLNETVAEIRADKSLTAAGKRIQMARATVEAKKLAGAAMEQHATERAQRAESARKVAFGSFGDSASDRLAMRDAHDRAAKIEKVADAEAMLARAIRDSDQSLAKAVAARAHERGWNSVANTYGTTFGCQTAIDELRVTPSGPHTATADRLMFRVRPPQELDAYRSDTDLQRLADADAAAAGELAAASMTAQRIR